MSRFARQTLELGLAHLPAKLLDTDSLEQLRGVAPCLATGRQLYFECRLAGPDRSVDVSQHFFLDDDGAPALQELASRQFARGGEYAAFWKALADFGAGWQAGDAIVEIGLEHDMAHGGVWSACPAIFAAFRRDALAERKAAEEFLARILPGTLPAWSNLVSMLEIAQAQGLQPGRMIGAMLSRDGQLRTMVGRLNSVSLRSFLRAVAWRGDTDALCGLLSEPPLASDATRLVLGFAPELSPHCGLELIHARTALGEAERECALDWLVNTGLATKGRVAALRDWAGPISPLNAKAHWPDAMLVRGLLRPEPRPYFATFVNHLKLNLPDRRPILPAKAYLSIAPVPTGLAASARDAEETVNA